MFYLVFLSIYIISLQRDMCQIKTHVFLCLTLSAAKAGGFSVR